MLGLTQVSFQQRLIFNQEPEFLQDLNKIQKESL